MRGINSDSIDLIYLDPPFNKKKQFTAPIGSNAEGAEFKDWWGKEDVKDSWLIFIKEQYPDLYSFCDLSRYIGDESNKYYLVYMAMRLLEMKRILKPTGSIYLHCDQTMSHFLKLLMDVIFGYNNFRNEIIWCYADGANAKKQYNKKHDTILFFTKSDEWYFDYNSILRPLSDSTIKKYKNEYENGKYRLMGRGIVGSPIQSARDINPEWEKTNPELTFRHYLKDGALPLDWIEMPPINQMAKERMGYPTQKPLALLERIIKASCPEGGLVLDPFCGCATTCVAADKLGREWIGIDISKKAYELVEQRLNTEVADKSNIFKYQNKLYFRDDIPDRTDNNGFKLIGKAKQQIKEMLYGKEGGNCAGCGQHYFKENLEIDHIIPKAKGGSDEPSNLQLLCSYCNRVKGDRPMEELLAKLKAVRG